MRTVAIAVLIAVFPAASALAQIKPATNKLATRTQPAVPSKGQPEKRTKACAEYGAGFVQIEGTGTCVKIGGYVRMQDSVR